MVVAAVLVIVGFLGTFGGLLTEKIGVWSAVGATLALLVGIFLRRI